MPRSLHYFARGAAFADFSVFEDDYVFGGEGGEAQVVGDISMVTEKNNMHDIDTFMFFKWFFKAWVAVFIVTHTFDITMAVFDVAQHVVSGASGVISSDTSMDIC